jgi:hypothetical protein
MGVHFAETMAGSFTDTAGEKKPIVFTVKAMASKAKAFVTGAPMRLEGTMTVGGICRNAPATGSLEVKLLTEREIVYTLVFMGDDGATYRYVGKKSVSGLNLLKSMTTLRGNLTRERDVVGTAELSFSLRDIPEFMKSFGLA